MKAAVHVSYGPPEVVRISVVKMPVAKHNELLVKVHATTVNRTDCGFRSGKPFFSRFFTGLVKPRGTILGNEFAGEVEAVGKSSFGRCRRLLKPGGIYLSTEGRLLFLTLIFITPLLGGKKVVFALPKLDQATVRQFKQLIESGQFKPLIDRRYPLDQIVAAYRYVETGQKVGNVVISVGPPD